MNSRFPFLRTLRILGGLLALALGFLTFLAGVMAPGAVKLWSTGQTYYQLVLDPPPYWQLLAAVAISSGLALLALPFIQGGPRK